MNAHPTNFAGRFDTPTLRRDAYVTDSASRQYSLWRWAAGVASEFIHHLPALAAKRGGLRVVLYVRVSSPRQEAEGNLAEAVQAARAAVEALGCEIVGVFDEVSHSGIHFVSDKKGYSRNRLQFERAVECCREHCAVLVAAERDRLLRGRLFNSRTGRHEKPVVGEYVLFRNLTRGIEVATIAHPDGSARPHQTRRGFAAKDARPGRPRKPDQEPGCLKRRREDLLPVALKLRAAGLTYREITSRLNTRTHGWQPVTCKTVFNWVQTRNPAKPSTPTRHE